MSNIEQSLSLLLPSLSDHLPTELIALANSLLAQSRNKASNLKSEEEIARPYACAEIACKRLGSKLRLPALNARPPCAPRVYKKLLTFLEQVLPAKLPTTPKKDTSRASGDGALLRGTPRKAVSRSAQSTPGTTPRKRSTAFLGKIAARVPLGLEKDDDGAPAWAMPLIRRLCQTMSTPLLPPHVYTGLCVVSRLAAITPSDEDGQAAYRRDMTGLTLALFFLVLARMQRGQVSTESYLKDCERACAVANMDDNNENITNARVAKEQVDDWIKTASSENWTTGQEWWSSVPENIFDRAGQEPPEELEDDTAYIDINITSSKRRWRQTADTGEDPEGVLLPGLGTMMQEGVDWLGEDRRADYLDWRANIEKRLDRMLGKQRRTKRIKGKAVAVS